MISKTKTTSGTVGIAPAPQWYGIYSAVVYDNNDPLAENRVRLQIPQVMGTAISNWAIPSFTGGVVPEQGQKVHAMFLGGDINKPIYFFDQTTTALASVVQMYGQAGTFGGLTNATKTASGHSFKATSIANWKFGPGEALYYTESMTDGQVVMGTVSLMFNELAPTADHAEINVFDPLRKKFYSNIIPTSTGALKAVSPSSGLGGTDVGGGDLRRIIYNNKEYLIFTCTGYYFNWNIPTYGLYPTIGFLTRTSGDWNYNQGISLTGDQWEATNPTTFQAVINPTQNTGVGANYWGPRFTNQIAVFPKSNNIVIGHYFGRGTFTSGCISVIDPTGALKAAYQIPNITPISGTITTAAVRDVETDPSSSLNDERFVIVYDGFGSGLTIQHPFQEFSYNANTQTIAPKSVPCYSTDDDAGPGFVIIDNNGTLYLTQNSLTGSGLITRNTVVYRKKSGERNNVTLAPANPGWETGTWPTAVAPDYSTGFAVQQNIGWEAGPTTVDPATGSILMPGSASILGILTPNADISSFGSNILSAANSGFETSNLLSTDDSIFASSLGNWTPFLAIITQVTPPVAPPTGTKAMQMQPAFGATVVQNTAYSALPNTRYQFQGYLLAGTLGRSCDVYFQWFDGSNNFISETAHTTVTDNSTTWTVANVIQISPANAASLKIFVTVTGAAPAENHYLASNSFWNMSVEPDWTGFVTTVQRSAVAARSGSFSMAISAPFNNETLAAIGPHMPVVPFQEYLGSAWFKADSVGQHCTLSLKFFDVSNNLLSTASQGTSITDNTSTWTQAKCPGWAPANSSYAVMTLLPTTSTIGETHYVDDIVFQTQPFTSPGPVDLGLTVLRQTYSNISTNRGTVVNRKFYIPLGQGLSSSEQTDYNNGKYTIRAKPQFLVAVDLAQILSR